MPLNVLMDTRTGIRGAVSVSGPPRGRSEGGSRICTLLTLVTTDRPTRARVIARHPASSSNPSSKIVSPGRLKAIWYSALFVASASHS